METKGQGTEKTIPRRDFLKELGSAALGFALVGCGNAIIRRAESKATPTPEPKQPKSVAPPEPTPTIAQPKGEQKTEVETTKAVFVFEEGVPEDQQKQIRDVVTKAEKWFSSHGLDLGEVMIFTFNDGKKAVDQFLQRSPTIPPSEHKNIRENLSRATAFSGTNHDFFIISTSPGWNSASPIIGGPVVEGRYHTVAHELFHVWQRNMGAYKYEPVAWLNEGVPHYIAALFLRDTGLYPFEKIRNGHLLEAAKVKDLLSSLESNRIFYQAGNPATADEYSLAFLAVEYLTRTSQNSGVNAIVEYWKKIAEGLPHQTSFQLAFGKTPTAFYKEFETFRQQGFK